MMKISAMAEVTKGTLFTLKKCRTEENNGVEVRFIKPDPDEEDAYIVKAVEGGTKFLVSAKNLEPVTADDESDPEIPDEDDVDAAPKKRKKKVAEVEPEAAPKKRVKKAVAAEVKAKPARGEIECDCCEATYHHAQNESYIESKHGYNACNACVIAHAHPRGMKAFRPMKGETWVLHSCTDAEDNGKKVVVKKYTRPDDYIVEDKDGNRYAASIMNLRPVKVKKQ
jgi:hypothetical protein